MCLYKIHREAETMALISSSRPKTAPTTTNNKLSSQTDMRWDSAYFTKYIKVFPFDTLRILKSTIYRVVMCSI